MPRQYAATPPSLNVFIRVCAIAMGVLSLASGCTQAHAQATPVRAASASDAPVSAAERAQSTRRVALLIGNSAYSKLRRLDNPSNDVRLIEATLRGLGFTEIVGGTQKGLDVTAGDMQVLLADFGRLSAGAEMAVVYFAGHGLVAKATNEQFLTGVEAGNDERRLKTEALSLTDIMDTLNQFGAASNFVFLDACRESARGGGMRSVTPKRDAANTVILYATAADELAADGRSGSNSPFTKALAEELKVPDQEWAAMQRAIVNRVAIETNEKQEPKAYGSFRRPVHFKVTVEAGASNTTTKALADMQKGKRVRIPTATSALSAIQIDEAWNACKKSPVRSVRRAGTSFYPNHQMSNGTRRDVYVNDAGSFVQMEYDASYLFGAPPVIRPTKPNQLVASGESNVEIFSTSGLSMAPSPGAASRREEDALSILYVTAYSAGGSQALSYDINCAEYELTWCGDGVVDQTAGEVCDDGAKNGHAGYCNASCTGRSETQASVVQQANSPQPQYATVVGTATSSNQSAKHAQDVVCDTRSQGVLRAGKSHIFAPIFTNSNQKLAFVNQVTAAIFPAWDYEGKGTTSNSDFFQESAELIDRNYLIKPNEGVVTMRSSGYPILHTPPARARDNLRVISRSTYSLMNSDKAWGAGKSLAHCADYQISWCGDGVVDVEDGETCDDGELNGSPGKCNISCTGPTR